MTDHKSPIPTPIDYANAQVAWAKRSQMERLRGALIATIHKRSANRDSKSPIDRVLYRVTLGFDCLVSEDSPEFCALADEFRAAGWALKPHFSLASYLVAISLSPLPNVG